MQGLNGFLFLGIFYKKKMFKNTAPTQNSDIYKYIDTPFALTKMSLFWKEEDFVKKNTLILNEKSNSNIGI